MNTFSFNASESFFRGYEFQNTDLAPAKEEISRWQKGLNPDLGLILTLLFAHNNPQPKLHVDGKLIIGICVPDSAIQIAQVTARQFSRFVDFLRSAALTMYLCKNNRVSC